MKNVFAIMGDGTKVELDSFVKTMGLAYPEADWYVGCDSQNYSSETVYVTTVLLRFPQNGAQVVYFKERVKRIEDLWTRLWAETERSIEVALYLEKACGVEVKQIDMDYNSDPSFPSNKLIPPAIGYAESLGFVAKTKPSLLMATWAANVLCHR